MLSKWILCTLCIFYCTNLFLMYNLCVFGWNHKTFVKLFMILFGWFMLWKFHSFQTITCFTSNIINLLHFCNSICFSFLWPVLSSSNTKAIFNRHEKYVKTFYYFKIYRVQRYQEYQPHLLIIEFVQLSGYWIYLLLPSYYRYFPIYNMQKKLILLF